MQQPTPKTALFAQWIQGRLVVVDQALTTGNVWFVGSAVSGATDSAGYGRSPEAPFATINYAISQATASNGDLILVLPGHVETVTAAAGLALSKAGLRIVGLGQGANRPQINFTTVAGASCDITAANNTLDNIVFKLNSVDALTAAVNVQAADVTIRNCRFLLGDATNQPVLGILTNASADRFALLDSQFVGTTDAGTTAAVRLVGGDGIRIERCQFLGGYGAGNGAIENITTAVTNLQVLECSINNGTASSTKAITAVAGTTGMVSRCNLQILSGTAPITAAGMSWVGGNYYAAAVATAGTLI